MNAREELIEQLFLEYDADRQSATKAVDRYLEANLNDSRPLEEMVEVIYSEQQWWG